MSLFFLLNPKSKLSLLAVMNQSYGDSVRKKKKPEERLDSDVIEAQLEKYYKVQEQIAAIRQQIKDETATSLNKQALEAQEIELLKSRIQLAHLILQLQEEEELLLMMLLH